MRLGWLSNRVARGGSHRGPWKGRFSLQASALVPAVAPAAPALEPSVAKADAGPRRRTSPGPVPHVACCVWVACRPSTAFGEAPPFRVLWLLCHAGGNLVSCSWRRRWHGVLDRHPCHTGCSSSCARLASTSCSSSAPPATPLPLSAATTLAPAAAPVPAPEEAAPSVGSQFTQYAHALPPLRRYRLWHVAFSSVGLRSALSCFSCLTE